MPVPWSAIACALSVLLTREARAEWPCADHTRHRIARSPRDGKPIGIAAANDRLVYGALSFVELNGDGKQDVVFASACIRSPADSVRLHRVYASCGAAADGVEDLVLLLEEEELCARPVAIEPQAQQTTVGGMAWRDLRLVQTSPGERCAQTIQALRFDGARYRSGPRTSQPCPKR